MTHNITLRPAIPTDIPILKHWDKQPHVIASDPNSDWEWEETFKSVSPFVHQLMVELDGKPLGFLQIIDAAREETHYWGKVPEGTMAIDIWIGEAENLGKGYGSQIMEMALGRCFALPETHTVLIDPLSSNVRAIRFYQRIGFVFLEERQFGPEHCQVYQFTREMWEQKQRSSSPL